MELESRQNSGDDYLQYCDLCGQQIPVMIFVNEPGTEELIASTCEGTYLLIPIFLYASYNSQ
jgi:hypothetical protein